MPRLTVFNHVSLDGYFVDRNGEMSWAKADPQDAEWNEFVSGNTAVDGTLVFGRVTYEMMAAFWPTPMAAQMMPDVAAGMNRMAKLVFSRTLTEASWQNTTLMKGDLLLGDPEAQGRRRGRHGDSRQRNAGGPAGPRAVDRCVSARGESRRPGRRSDAVRGSEQTRFRSGRLHHARSGTGTCCYRTNLCDGEPAELIEQVLRSVAATPHPETG